MVNVDFFGNCVPVSVLGALFSRPLQGSQQPPKPFPPPPKASHTPKPVSGHEHNPRVTDFKYILNIIIYWVCTEIVYWYIRYRSADIIFRQNANEGNTGRGLAVSRFCESQEWGKDRIFFRRFALNINCCFPNFLSRKPEVYVTNIFCHINDGHLSV